ncbi:MAG: regulatory protein RecX, partial [bacterium]|nr:regulatory protein RecX [bacterium]
RLKKRELENKKRQSHAEKLKSDPDLHLATKPLPLFSEDDIEAVISRLKVKNYLSDRKFAEFYIENRNLKKGISLRQLSQELSQKGIDRTLIDELLTTSPRSEKEEIQKIIVKRLKNPAKATPEKLTRYLLSKGFPYDLAKECIDQALNS